MVLVRSLNWDHSVVTVDEEEQTEDGVEGGEGGGMSPTTSGKLWD